MKVILLFMLVGAAWLDVVMMGCLLGMNVGKTRKKDEKSMNCEESRRIAKW